MKSVKEIIDNRRYYSECINISREDKSNNLRLLLSRFSPINAIKRELQSILPSSHFYKQYYGYVN